MDFLKPTSSFLIFPNPQLNIRFKGRVIFRGNLSGVDYFSGDPVYRVGRNKTEEYMWDKKGRYWVRREEIWLGEKMRDFMHLNEAHS